MKKFSIKELKQNPEAALAHAQQGGTVIIIGDDDQAFQLVATTLPRKGHRKAGLFKDQIKITDEFYEPLPEFKPYR